MSMSAIKARWGLFGHVMLMAHDTPAQMAIDEYIEPTATAGWQGRPRTTLPTTLYNDLQGVEKRLRNKQGLQHLYINLRRSRDCLWVSVRPSVAVSVAVWLATRRFIYLFWGRVAQST